MHRVALVIFDQLFSEAAPLDGGTHDLSGVCPLARSLFHAWVDVVGVGGSICHEATGKPLDLESITIANIYCIFICVERYFKQLSYMSSLILVLTL